MNVTITQTLLDNNPVLVSAGFAVNEVYDAMALLNWLFAIIKWQDDNACDKQAPGRPTKPPHL